MGSVTPIALNELSINMRSLGSSSTMRMVEWYSFIACSSAGFQEGFVAMEEFRVIIRRDNRQDLWGVTTGTGGTICAATHNPAPEGPEGITQATAALCVRPQVL